LTLAASAALSESTLPWNERWICPLLGARRCRFHSVAYLLLIMSIASWYYILSKAWAAWRIRRGSNALEQFWQAPTLADATGAMQRLDSEQIYTPMAERAAEAADIGTRQQGTPSLNAAPTPAN
jgi:biopolymer transport protein ExbB